MAGGDREPSWAAIVGDGGSTVFKRGARHGESVEAFMARIKDNIAWLDEQRVARRLPPAKRRLALFGKGVVEDMKLAKEP
jgi:hypothetical protein